MKAIREKLFRSKYDDPPGRVISDLHLIKCQFEGCKLGLAKSPGKRTIVRNCRLDKCSQKACGMSAVQIEDVVVDGLVTKDLFQTFGAVFKHVTIQGTVGRIMLCDYYPFDRGVYMEVFQKSARDYYQGVDWALDISEASFLECDLRGIPADLIRRDPETQMIVRRRDFEDGRWKRKIPANSGWVVAIETMLEFKYEDRMLVAAKRSGAYEAMLAELHQLRDLGYAT